MSTENGIAKEELYKIALETRNFEISMFWQRSNYFLVLNTAVAVGFFSLNDPFYTVPLSIFGFLVSLLWVRVNLGGKFWQSRWEEKLRLVELDTLPEIQFFSADPNTNREDVKASLDRAGHSGFRRLIDRLVLKKPSVSGAMTYLSLGFALLWIVFLVVAILK
jgi:hypothetical protein